MDPYERTKTQLKYSNNLSLSCSSAFPEDKIQFFFFHIYVFLRDDVFENFNEYLLSNKRHINAKFIKS